MVGDLHTIASGMSLEGSFTNSAIANTVMQTALTANGYSFEGGSSSASLAGAAQRSSELSRK